MSSKNTRLILTAVVLAVTLTAAPALAVGPQTREHSATSVETILSGLWNNVSTWLAGWWSPTAVPAVVPAAEKTQGPPSNDPCNGSGAGCAPVNPTGKDKVGSAIEPDGRPF